jgi:hypothetical protein
MSHTSQRRGLDPAQPGRELIVLAMIPRQHLEDDGIRSAMGEIAFKMLAHSPHNWLSRNYTRLHIPQFGPVQGLIRWFHSYWPEATQRLLLRAVSYRSSVITAIYTDPEQVVSLIDEIKSDWLQKGKEEQPPISIVLSGLFDDVHRCCRKTGSREHSYLHSLGFFGKIQDLPSREELEVITMCGHGLVAANRVRSLVEDIRLGYTTAELAAEHIARPCVCGIVNRQRAAEVFEILASV